MGKIAFIFPGQGAQYIGMGKDVAMEYKNPMLFLKMHQTLGFDIKK